MKELANEKLQEINSVVWKIIGIATDLIFLIGIFDGLIRFK